MAVRLRLKTKEYRFHKEWKNVKKIEPMNERKKKKLSERERKKNDWH